MSASQRDVLTALNYLNPEYITGNALTSKISNALGKYLIKDLVEIVKDYLISSWNLKHKCGSSTWVRINCGIDINVTRKSKDAFHIQYGEPILKTVNISMNQVIIKHGDESIIFGYNHKSELTYLKGATMSRKIKAKFGICLYQFKQMFWHNHVCVNILSSDIEVPSWIKYFAD
jgi:hypothetical protein